MGSGALQCIPHSRLLPSTGCTDDVVYHQYLQMSMWAPSEKMDFVFFVFGMKENVERNLWCSRCKSEKEFMKSIGRRRERYIHHRYADIDDISKQTWKSQRCWAAQRCNRAGTSFLVQNWKKWGLSHQSNIHSGLCKKIHINTCETDRKSIVYFQTIPLGLSK